jgi:type IV pilus assembly protein PilC
MAQKLEPLALSVFFENMAMMLEAGITPEEAVGLLREDHPSGDLGSVLERLERSLVLDGRLSTAVRESGAFPGYACRMVDIGEQAGRLEQVLRSLSLCYQRQEQLRRQLQSAVIYPVVLLLMMSLVLAVMVSLVLPVFVEVYESMTGVLASSSFGYIRFANAVSWVSLITVGLISTAVLACFVLRRGEKGQQVLNRLLQRLPMTREAMLELELSRFFDVLATFLSSGMDVDLAMEEASEVLTEPTLTEKALEARRSMAAGESLGKALYGMGVLNALYARMILSAERSGQIEPTMARLADTVGEDANLRMQGLISAVEPLLTVFLTASVGVTLLSVMLPLAGMLSAIG